MRPIEVPFVEREASIDRAIHLTESGKNRRWRKEILSLLHGASVQGWTWKELSIRLGLHHGQISGILSKLHEEGEIFALTTKRDGSHPYCSRVYRDAFLPEQRVDAPARTKARRNRERLAKITATATEISDLIDAWNAPDRLLDAHSIWADAEIRFLFVRLLGEIVDES